MNPSSESRALCECNCGNRVLSSTARFLHGHHKRVRPVIEQASPFRIADEIDDSYCRLIPLTRGQYAIVNESDYRWLMQWKWMAMFAPNVNGFYAARWDGGRCIKLHRLLCGDDIEGLNVDHRNGHTLDDRKKNLRSADTRESTSSRGIFKNNTSGYKNVTWHKRVRMWQARLGYKWGRIHLGYYKTPEEAYAVYCEAAKKYHKEFARTK